MSFNQSDSFFGTPTSTSPVKLGEKAAWEITTAEDCKMTAEFKEAAKKLREESEDLIIMAD